MVLWPGLAGAWLLISIVAITQPDLDASFSRGAQRVSGTLVSMVAAIGLGQASPGGMGVANLVDAFRDDTTSNLVVMLLRLITSAEVQRRADFFLPFILVGIVGLFCFVLLVSLCILRCFCVFLL